MPVIFGKVGAGVRVKLLLNRCARSGGEVRVGFVPGSGCCAGGGFCAWGWVLRHNRGLHTLAHIFFLNIIILLKKKMLLNYSRPPITGIHYNWPVYEKLKGGVYS